MSCVNYSTCAVETACAPASVVLVIPAIMSSKADLMTVEEISLLPLRGKDEEVRTKIVLILYSYITFIVLLFLEVQNVPNTLQ